MNMVNEFSLFTDSIRYNDRATSENRLTQVFAAAFNNSPIVRKIFFELIGCNEPSQNSYVETQQQDDGSTRPDMVIYFGENRRNFIIVESKTDMKEIDPEQLRCHQNFGKNRGNAICYVLISRYQYKVPKNWVDVRWHDFGLKLSDLVLEPDKSIDHFVCKSFIVFLREYKYMKSSRISAESFENASQCIYNIRALQNVVSANFLLDLQNVSDFLSLCIENMGYSLIEENNNRIVQKSSGVPSFGCWKNKNISSNNKGISLRVKQSIRGMRNRVSHCEFAFQQKISDSSKFVLCFNLWWENDSFVTIACFDVDENSYFRVWKISTKRWSYLDEIQGILTVDDVLSVAREQWLENYARGYEDLSNDCSCLMNYL